MSAREQPAHARPYHGAMNSVARRARAGIALAIVSVLGWLGGCSDNPSGPPPPPPEELVVSDPVLAAGVGQAAVSVSALSSSAGDELAYVSLPPGTVPTGSDAIIRRVGDAAPSYATMRDGGFDPVPVAAQPGDSVVVLVTAGGGTVAVFGVAVSVRRPPIVVRTDPPRRKTDVAVNAAIAVVFSEPVAGGTLTSSSVRLFRGTTAVAGSVRLLAGTATAAAFVPSAPLDPNTAYRLEVTRAVRDLEGDTLAADVTMEFTTGQSSTGPAASIALSPDSVFMTGATYQMTATVRDGAGNLLIDQPITWSTDDPSGLTVSPTGLLTALVTKSYTVTASLGSLQAFAVVDVPAGPPASLTVLPTEAVVGAGDTIILAATVRDATGRLLELPSVAWTSSAPAVATVAGSDTVRLAFGTVTGMSLGSATITATSGTASGTAAVTVIPPLPAASVTVTPASATLVVQGTTQLSATVQDVNGKVLAGRLVTWTSDNPPIATVDANGSVRGVGVGTAAVTATSEGVSDTAAITVTLLSFATVTAGTYHSCGLTTSGAAYCWGDNRYGQLGASTATAQCRVDLPCSATPVAVTGGLTFSAVSAGRAHTCGVTTSRAVYCWGANGDGQRGDGSTTSSSVPVAVIGGLTFSAVSAGVGGAGNDHTCGVTTSGAVYCWGASGHGELGSGSETGPEQCPDGSGWCSTRPVAVTGGLTFSGVTAGDLHTCGVTTSGAAYCWGANFSGELGNGSTVSSSVPVAVTGGLTFSGLSAGADHSCGLTTAGAAYCWGHNVFGELGNGSTVSSSIPVPVTGGLTFSSVSAGGARFPHTCGVTTGAAAYCWGNYFLSDGAVTAPVPVTGGLSFAGLSAGGDHRCGLTVGGVAYCWGDNRLGQLGDGTTTSSISVPVKVAGQP